MTSRNCSNINPCPKNQECILTSSGYGYCICPKGFTLEANGFCRDINECTEMEEFNLCGPNSECINLPGAYECLCSAGFTGIGKVGCNRIGKYFTIVFFSIILIYFYSLKFIHAKIIKNVQKIINALINHVNVCHHSYLMAILVKVC